MIHELKCHPEPFEAKWLNKKNWEIRKNDRNFQVGDILIEKWFSPVANNGTGAYDGTEIHEEVLWILPEGYGLKKGFIIMSTKQLKRVRIMNGERQEFTEPYN